MYIPGFQKEARNGSISDTARVTDFGVVSSNLESFSMCIPNLKIAGSIFQIFEKNIKYLEYRSDTF